MQRGHDRLLGVLHNISENNKRKKVLPMKMAGR